MSLRIALLVPFLVPVTIISWKKMINNEEERNTSSDMATSTDLRTSNFKALPTELRLKVAEYAWWPKTVG